MSDAALLHYVIQLRRPWLDDVMLLASALGSAGFIWWVTALIAMVFPNQRSAAWQMVLAVLVTWTISEFVLTRPINRPRPFTVDSTLVVIDAKPTTPAFPSSHAAMAAAGAVAGSRMLPGAGVVWATLAAVVAISQVYVGVHWPTDVIAGAVAGLAIAWFVLGGLRKSAIRLRR